jgi:hypothetical protein
LAINSVSGDMGPRVAFVAIRASKGGLSKALHSRQRPDFVTSIDECGICKCRWLSKDLAAASCGSASTNEYNIMSFLVSEVPLDETRLALPPAPVSVIKFA